MGFLDLTEGDLTTLLDNGIISPIEYLTFGAGCNSRPVVQPTSVAQQLSTQDTVKLRGRR
jgi:hypothetical protein